MIQKMLLKYAYNDMRSHKEDCSFFDEEIKQFLMNSNLEISYVFRFNSVQFLLLCWDKESNKIEQNRTVLRCQYPYYLMNEAESRAVLPICTDELNYHRFDHIHVRWDGLFEVGLMRKYASGGNYKYKELYERAWKEEEKKIKDEHSR